MINGYGLWLTDGSGNVISIPIKKWGRRYQVGEALIELADEKSAEAAQKVLAARGVSTKIVVHEIEDSLEVPQSADIDKHDQAWAEA